MLFSYIIYIFAQRNQTKEELTMLGKMIVKTRKVKTWKEVSIQVERIVTLYYKGYGSEKMFHTCENIYFREYEKNGGY